MNTLLPTLILAGQLLLLAVSSGQEDDEHHIDKWLSQSMDENSSNAGMRTSLNKAREMWDAEMNACYKRLLLKLPEEKQEILKKAQRAWLAFRDADGEAIGAIVSSQQGTMYQLLGTDLSYQRVRDRALQLLAYEHVLSQAGEF